jgi:hypothetical protein
LFPGISRTLSGEKSWHGDPPTKDGEHRLLERSTQHSGPRRHAACKGYAVLRTRAAPGYAVLHRAPWVPRALAGGRTSVR